MAAISRSGLTVASAAVLLLACGPLPPSGTRPGTVPGTEEPKAMPLSQVFVLEAAGAMPDDTVVSVTRGRPRVVVLRRSAPDFGLFARLELTDSSLKASNGSEPARLTVRPRPGEYALDLEIAGSIGGGASLVFSYGSHFVAPAGARERYGSDLLFERELRIARLGENNQVLLLPTWRPGTDMVGAELSAPGPGRYLVVAPR